MDSNTTGLVDHRRQFAEFCKWEMASGGPDPQLKMVRHMAQPDSVGEREHLWRALCWIAVYNVPYGEVLWRNWPLGDVRPDTLEDWLDKAFTAGKITTRIERRAVRRADWMHEYLIGAVRFIEHQWDDLYYRCQKANDGHAAYELAWETVLTLPRVGRYAAIKLIEYMRRYLDLPVLTPDIRPHSAWSPRHTLGYLFPDRQLGNRDNSEGALFIANQACRDALTLLRDDYHVRIDMFELQVLLCEYRESWESRKQYPGRSLDSELGYTRRAEADWGYESSIWEARMNLFPAHHLGENRGWDGPRKACGQCLTMNGYTWSDLLYDFTSTTDMNKPVEWRVG